MRTRRGLRRSASLPPAVAVAVDETSDVNRTAHAALNGSGSANTTQISIRDKHRTGPPDGGPLAEIPLVKTTDRSGTSGGTRSDAMSHDLASRAAIDDDRHRLSTKIAHHSISRQSGRSSISVNERTFPQRFASAKSGPERSSKFMWEESTREYELGELLFQAKELTTPKQGVPLKPDSHSGMSGLSRREGKQKILLDRMNKVQTMSTRHWRYLDTAQLKDIILKN